MHLCEKISEFVCVTMKIADFLFKGVGVPKFETYLDLSAFKHKLTAGNIANAATPGYKSRSMDFQAEFERLSGESKHLPGKLTHPGHLPLGHHRYADPEVESQRPGPDDLNSVDIDHEVADMARNELQFTIAARLLAKKFQGLSRAIKGQ